MRPPVARSGAPLVPLSPLAALAVLCVAAPLAAVARGSELPASGAASGLTVHGPEETLRDFCRVEQGQLWLELPGGARYELVSSTSDPAIANPGDGSFHPFEEAEVCAALGALRYPIGSVRADVFLLPYPRRYGLDSAAGPQLVLLSPGVWPLTPERQHAEFIHELGHVVQYASMPDADSTEWKRYRELRGITDTTVYNASAPHADRPHEIFAEDFRALLGGALATYSGTVENSTLAPPASVPGLEEFVRAVAGGWAPAVARRLSCFPNPSSGATSFARAGGEAVALDVYDLRGRRVATLNPVSAAGALIWRWDGRDATGATVGAGVFFARPREGGGALSVTRVR